MTAPACACGVEHELDEATCPSCGLPTGHEPPPVEVATERAPVVQVTPCPACQGPRRAKEGMAYCVTKRCKAGLQRWRKP